MYIDKDVIAGKEIKTSIIQFLRENNSQIYQRIRHKLLLFRALFIMGNCRLITVKLCLIYSVDLKSGLYLFKTSRQFWFSFKFQKLLSSSENQLLILDQNYYNVVVIILFKSRNWLLILKWLFWKFLILKDVMSKVLLLYFD